MFKRYWGPAIAIGIALLNASVALSQQPKQPALKGEPVPSAGQQERAQERKAGPSNKEQNGSDLLPAIKGIEAAIRDHIAKEDKAESERKEKREIADLKAQQDMVAYAKRMYWATVASVVVTFVGLVLILGNLHYTRKATNTAADQVRLSRHALVDTDRAFVYPKETIWAAGRNPTTNVVFEWQIGQRWENSGNTPTRHLTVYFHRAVIAAELPEPFDFPSTLPLEPISTFIAPKATLDSIRFVITLQELNAIRNGTLFLYTWGWAEYDDVFERTPRHRTEFCYRWVIGGDVTNPDRMSTRWTVHKQHNGADEECLKPLQTGSPKNPL